MTTVGDVGAMYETGVLVENPAQYAALFRERMGYKNPDPQLSKAVAAPNQSNWFGKTHFKTPLVSGIHNGLAPGQEIETTLYQKRAMNPIWPPPPKHRMAMINPSWQMATNAYGGHSGTIEMLAGNHQFPLPSANDSLEQVSSLALDENARKAIHDPLSNTFALNQLRQEQSDYHGEAKERELRYHADAMHSEALGEEDASDPKTGTRRTLDGGLAQGGIDFLNRRRKDRGEFPLGKRRKSVAVGPSDTQSHMAPSVAIGTQTAFRNRRQTSFSSGWFRPGSGGHGDSSDSGGDSGLGGAGHGRGPAGHDRKILSQPSTRGSSGADFSDSTVPPGKRTPHEDGLASAATGRDASSSEAFHSTRSGDSTSEHHINKAPVAVARPVTTVDATPGLATAVVNGVVDDTTATREARGTTSTHQTRSK